MTTSDLGGLREIDATYRSSDYLHVDRAGEGLSASWKIEPRPLREQRTTRLDLTDDQVFTIKQIVSGVEEGAALIGEHEGQLVAAAATRFDPMVGVSRLVDLRVDYDLRRQGIASAMLFQMIQDARDQQRRAVAAEVPADNFPAAQLLSKLGFEAAGLDTHFRTNHDLVKETVAIFWYLALE